MADNQIGQRSAGANTPADIAIIGMSCLFPGAPDLRSYWQNILAKRDCITEPPAEAWDPARFYDPGAGTNDRLYCRVGGFLGPLAQFDPLKNQVMPNAVMGSEPDQWLALSVARAAFADAGYSDQIPERHKTAVILGKGNYPNRGNSTVSQHGHVVDQTLEILRRLHPEYTEDELAQIRADLKRSLPPFNSDTAPGLIPNVVAGRIANQFDLMGPSYTVDAACASFLVAAQAAIRGLRSGEFDLALVGAVQVWTPAPMQMLFSQLGALSRQEQIRPFDVGADGTILGEGVGMVVLKRAADAQQDGNRIYAAIKGIGIASDGRGVGVLAPRLEGEILALQKAYADANLAPQTVHLIEAHGTGTQAGDAAELEALSQVFGMRKTQFPPTALGTVKSMLGHLLPAAGVAGLIKTALALYHKVLPPTLHVEHPHPKLLAEQAHFYANTDWRTWIHGARTHPRRAGVNAFGFGGINGHAVLEEYVTPDQPFAADDPLEWASELILIRAASQPALIDRIDQIAQFIEQAESATLKDLAYTLNTDAAASAADTAVPPVCLAVVAKSILELAEYLQHARTRLSDPDCRQIKDTRGIYYFAEPLAQDGKLAFLFPGEGSQYAGMLAELCLHFPEVRAYFDRTDRVFAAKERGFAPSDYIFPRPSFSATDEAPASDDLWDMDHAVESILTANQALLFFLQQLEIAPDALVGHSSGDYTALIASGMIDVTQEVDFEQFALELNSIGDVEEPAATQYALVAAGISAEKLAPYLDDAGGDLHIAMANCPHQTVVAGSESAIGSLLDKFQANGVLYERLRFDRPYHTPLVDELGERLRPFFQRWIAAPPQIPTYSCTTGSLYPADLHAAQNLAVEHWLRPVEFDATVRTLYEDGVRLFVEVGARGNLTAFLRDILRGKRHVAAATNLMNRDELTQIHHLLGLLAAHGVSMKLDYLYARRAPARLDLAAPHAGQAAAAGADMSLKLQTGWPEMTLSTETAEALRKSSHARSSQTDQTNTVTTDAMIEELPAAGAATALSHPSPNGDYHPRVDAAEGMNPVGMNGAAHHPPSAQSQPSSSGGATGPDRSDKSTAGQDTEDAVPGASADDPIMSTYFDTMDQFLSMQTEIMQAYLGGKHGPGTNGQPLSHGTPATPVEEAPPAPPAQDDEQPAAPAPGTPPAQPVQEPAPAPAHADTASSSPAHPMMEVDAILDLLLRLVSERTGYPVEILDVNIDLEASLGIDSIKRVEILGQFQREAGVNVAAAMEALSSRKTLQEVVDLLAEHIGAAASPTETPPKAAANGTAVSDAAGNDTAARHSLPFLGEIITRSGDDSVVVRRTVDPAQDRFLRDHTLGRNVSTTDETLTGLPVMPLTMSLEIMAEAASLLLPGKRVIGMRDVRAMRWISFDTGARELEISATRRPSADPHQSAGQVAVHTSIRETGDPAAAQSPVVEAIVLFADDYPAPKPPDARPLTAERASHWLPERLYADGMFHGPMFQGVQSIDRWGEDGATAILQLNAPDPLFATQQGRAMLTDPVLLDQPGQVVAFWLSELEGRQTMILPYTVRALDLYGPPPWQQAAAPAKEQALSHNGRAHAAQTSAAVADAHDLAGDQAHCRVRITQQTPTVVESDLDIVLPDGTLWARLEGWTDRRFDLPVEYIRFLLDPSRTALSVPSSLLADRWAEFAPFTLHVFQTAWFPQAVFTGQDGIWTRALAHTVLSRRERPIWQTGDLGEKRRLDWLLGRVVAKDAVRNLVRQQVQLTLCPADVEVIADANNRPEIEGAWLHDGPARPLVSLSHADGVTVALAGTTDDARGIGIDVQSLTHRHEGFERLAFTEGEQALLAASGTGPAWPLRLWCAKEAVAKALGTGMLGGPQSLFASSIESESGKIQIHLAGELAERFPAIADAGMTAYTVCQDDLIIAAAIDSSNSRSRDME